MDGPSRLRKRVRHPQTRAVQQPPPETSETQPTRQKKAGQQQTDTLQSETQGTEGIGGASEDELGQGTRKGSKPIRQSLDNLTLGSESSLAQGEENGSLTRRAAGKRKRPVQRAIEEQPDEKAESGPISRTQKRTRRTGPSQSGQSSANAAAEPESALARKKQDRPPGAMSGQGSGTQSRNKSSKSQKDLTNKKSRASSKQPQPRGARRKSQSPRPSEEQNSSPNHPASPEADPPLPYRHIAKRTQQVTHEVMESKWSSLEPSSIANIATLLYSVSQPTLHRVVPKQYTHAEEVLEKVIRALCRRSGRLPFPPASTLPRREDELDFEQTQTAVESLLSQLDPLQHSVEVLRSEKERAEKDLEREYKLLDQLSTNARAEARERKEQLRKVHDLVPWVTHSDSSGDRLQMVSAEQGAGLVFSGIQDDDLLALAGQISSHMESMRGNLKQIDGVLPAIAESHALLKTTLQPHFGQKQLEDILFGRAEP
ncbi:CENP-Q, a CENPA-CAD centromere complex subunit-domain-containing protein [Xylaria sp. CBS 124048]|nr:CENP-Q, a CENPA-CAD centromere complex subunit-domain-containing protein [Xylaria sp. CBS 124048]